MKAVEVDLCHIYGVSPGTYHMWSPCAAGTGSTHEYLDKNLETEL